VSAVEAPTGLWGRLAERIQADPFEAEEGQGVWARLDDLTDLAQLTPKVSDDVEIKEFRLRWGNDYAIIANPRDLVYYRLEPNEVELVRLMDGTRTVKEIVVEHFKESGDLQLSGVADLVRSLQVGNFLDQRFVDIEAALKRATSGVSERRAKLRKFVRSLRVDWRGADRLVRFMYRRVLRYFFIPWVQILGLVFAMGGLAAFVDLVRTKRFALSGKSLAIGFLVLFGLNLLLVMVHEMGHAVTLIRYGRKVKSAGILIYFGSLAFFVDSSDGLMLDRGQRIVNSFAGPYASLIVAATASLLAWTFPGAAISPTLYKFAVLAYLIQFMNMIPLLELDGYWILSDTIQVPDLRPRSLAFIRHDLWHKLRIRERFSKQEIGLALYGILGVLFTIFSFYTAYFFWREIFGALVSRLWNGGAVTRVLLVALAVFVLGPVLRGAITLLGTLYRRLRAVGQRVRFRLERKWRVEAAKLIDELPLFDDVPIEVLDDLAGRVRLRTFARGQPVVRQGDRAEAFYVIRRGTLQVVEEDPGHGQERVLRVLGRGESFGELALMEAAPRSVTVRALEEAEVFEIEKGTFDQLLADMVNMPQFAPSLQAVAELRELKAFSHLEPDELAEVLDHGDWVNVAPGELIVEQGEVGDAFYAIRSGQADVYEDEAFVRTLGPGSYFGEIALLLDVPRTASVVAKTGVRAYRLERDGFDRLVRDAFRKGTLNPHMSPDRTWEH
jgi:CRP-like cAMP-binding protein/Zn-dependent protease